MSQSSTTSRGVSSTNRLDPRKVLARKFPFQGADGAHGTYQDVAPDRLLEMLANMDRMWPSTREHFREAIEALQEEPGLCLLPIGTKYLGVPLGEIPDGSVRWFSEEFSWGDPATFLCWLVKKEHEGRSLPRYHRKDGWDRDTQEEQVPEVSLMTLWGVPLSASLEGWWTVSEDAKGKEVRPVKYRNKRWLRAREKQRTRVEYVLPQEEVDKDPAEQEGEEAFDFDTETGNGPKYRKPSGWYLNSREEKRLREEGERQLDGREQAGVGAQRWARFQVLWHKEVVEHEDGSKEDQLSLRAGEEGRDEDGVRLERRKVSLYSKALEGIDRVVASPDEKELEWRAQQADARVFQLVLAESCGGQDGPPRHWLEDELAGAYEQRLRQLERREVSLGLYDGPKIKEGAKRRAEWRAADLKFSRFVEAGRWLRACETEDQVDDAIGRIEATFPNSFTDEQLDELEKQVAHVRKGLDRRPTCAPHVGV